MALSAAHTYDSPLQIGRLSLDSSFDVAAKQITPKTSAFQTLKDIAENATAATDVDELVLNPYNRSLKQQIFARILEGKSGEAIDMIYAALDGKDAAKVQNMLSDFVDEFHNLGLSSLAQELQELSILAPQHQFEPAPTAAPQAF